MKLGLGTECPLFPGREVGPQPVERGSVRWLGVCRKLPLFPPSPERLSAYLEENQAWKRISLSVFQRLGATKGFTSSGASMSAGSTDRAGEGNSAPSWEGVTGAAPVPGEALVPGGAFPGGLLCQAAAAEMALSSVALGKATFRITSLVSPAGTPGNATDPALCTSAHVTAASSLELSRRLVVATRANHGGSCAKSGTAAAGSGTDLLMPSNNLPQNTLGWAKPR